MRHGHGGTVYVHAARKHPYAIQAPVLKVPNTITGTVGIRTASRRRGSSVRPAING